jgi:hypothetical protein
VLLLFLTVGPSEPSSPFLPLFTMSAWAGPEHSSSRASLSSESLTGGTPLSAASSSLPSWPSQRRTSPQPNPPRKSGFPTRKRWIGAINV